MTFPTIHKFGCRQIRPRQMDLISFSLITLDDSFSNLQPSLIVLRMQSRREKNKSKWPRKLPSYGLHLNTKQTVRLIYSSMQLHAPLTLALYRVVTRWCRPTMAPAWLGSTPCAPCRSTRCYRVAIALGRRLRIALLSRCLSRCYRVERWLYRDNKRWIIYRPKLIMHFQHSYRDKPSRC